MTAILRGRLRLRCSKGYMQPFYNGMQSRGEVRVTPVPRHPVTYPATFRFLVSLFPVIALAIGCTHTIEPHRPGVSTSSATTIKLSPKCSQRTSPRGAALPLGRPVESILQITLAGDLTALQNAVSTAVPDAFDETRSPLGRAIRWTFQRQGAHRCLFRMASLWCGISRRYCAQEQYGRGPVYPMLDWHVPLTTKQNGPNVVIRPEGAEASIGLKPESDDKCNMFAVPLKEQLPEMVNLTEVKEQMARAVGDTAVAIPIQGSGGTTPWAVCGSAQLAQDPTLYLSGPLGAHVGVSGGHTPTSGVAGRGESRCPCGDYPIL